MEKCFDDGERDKKKRCTTLKCRKIMERELGDEMALSETQIGSYWSVYKSRKKTKNEKYKYTGQFLRYGEIIFIS